VAVAVAVAVGAGTVAVAGGAAVCVGVTVAVRVMASVAVTPAEGVAVGSAWAAPGIGATRPVSSSNAALGTNRRRMAGFITHLPCISAMKIIVQYPLRTAA
jgi:hypothetical protein